MITASRNNSEVQRKPLMVAATGFEAKTRAVFEQFVKKLGGLYSENLTVDANVLIASTVSSDKYRAACIINIPVVTSQWLSESVQNGSFLPFQTYYLPIFKGLVIGVLGFPNDQVDELKTLLEKREGKVCVDVDRIQEERSLNLIVVKKDNIKHHDNFIMAQKVPIVTTDWLKNCLLFNQYLIPKKYAINTSRSSDRQSATQWLNDTLNTFQQLEGYLARNFNDYEVGNDKYEFLEETVIYFHNLPDKLEKIQKKLVNMAGGTYVKHILPEVTHIVTTEYVEDEVKTFHKYRQTKIVDILWLKDCFIFRRLIKEDDYLVHPVPQALVEIRNITPPNKTFAESKPIVSLSRRNTVSFQSQTPLKDTKLTGRSVSYSESKSNTLIRSNSGAPTLAIRRNGTITEEDEEEETDKKKEEDFSKTKGDREGKENKDVDNSMLPPMHTPQKHGKSSKHSKSKKSVVQVKGYVFKNINFYFDSKYKELANHKRIVQENSGKILDSLNVFEEIFYILPDSEESTAIFRRNGTKKNIIFVSYRWIDYCLRTKLIVRDLQEQNLIHLYPFSHKVPFQDFSSKTIYAAGLPPYKKTIMKEVIELCGAKFAYEPSNLTVLVCQDISSKKYTEMREKYPNTPIVNPVWVFNCLANGKMVDFQDSLIC